MKSDTNVWLWMWQGLWQGIGVELSFFVLWVGWRIAHSKVMHKFGPDHLIHKIHNYFD